MGTAYKSYRVTSPPDVRGIGRSKPFVRFEIFNFHNSFGCIFVLFLWQQQDFNLFWRRGHFKIQTKSIWKIYSYFKGSMTSLVPTCSSLSLLSSSTPGVKHKKVLYPQSHQPTQQNALIFFSVWQVLILPRIKQSTLPRWVYPAQKTRRLCCHRSMLMQFLIRHKQCTSFVLK